MKKTLYILLITAFLVPCHSSAATFESVKNRTIQYIKDEYGLLQRNMATVQKLTHRQTLTPEETQDLKSAGKRIAAIGTIIAVFFGGRWLIRKVRTPGLQPESQREEEEEPLIARRVSPQQQVPGYRLPPDVTAPSEQLPPPPTVEQEEARRPSLTESVINAPFPPLPMSESSMERIPAPLQQTPPPLSSRDEVIAPGIEPQPEIGEEPSNPPAPPLPPRPFVQTAPRRTFAEELEAKRTVGLRKPPLEPRPLMKQRGPQRSDIDINTELNARLKQRAQQQSQQTSSVKQPEIKQPTIKVTPLKLKLQAPVQSPSSNPLETMREHQMLGRIQETQGTPEEQTMTRSWIEVPKGQEAEYEVVIEKKPQVQTQPKVQPTQKVQTQTITPAPSLGRSALDWMQTNILGRRTAIEGSDIEKSTTGSSLNESEDGN